MKKLNSKNLSLESIGAIFIFIFGSILSLLQINLGFSWPIFLVFILVALFVSLKNPQSGLLAVIPLVFYFERFFTLQSFWINRIEYKIYPLDILLLGIFLGILFNYKKFLRKEKIFGSEDWLLALFIIWNVIYFLTGFVLDNGEKSLIFSSFKNYAFYPLFFFATVLILKNEKDIKRFFRFFMISSVGILFFILYGFLFSQGLWSEYTPLSTSGTRTLAFTHSLYASIALILFWLYLTLKNPRNNKCLVLSFIFILGIIGGLMRHLWVGVFGSLIIIFFLLEKKEKEIFSGNLRKIFFAGIIIFVISFHLANLFPTSKINHFYSETLGIIGERSYSMISAGEDESFSWRGLVWKSAFLEFKNNIFLGIGTGKRIFVEKEFYRDFIEMKNIHNSYLSILFQLGIVGFVFFAGFLWKKIKNLFRITKVNMRFFKLSVLGVIGLFIFSIPFQPYLETNMLSIFFWMFLGVGKSLELIEKNENTGN